MKSSTLRDTLDPAFVATLSEARAFSRLLTICPKLRIYSKAALNFAEMYIDLRKQVYLCDNRLWTVLKKTLRSTRNLNKLLPINNVVNDCCK